MTILVLYIYFTLKSNKTSVRVLSSSQQPNVFVLHVPGQLQHYRIYSNKRPLSKKRLPPA